ncbi:MAG: O-antigen ligase family protein, partial [Planctomycetota bacterium]
MSNKDVQTTTSTEPGLIPYCDQIIIAMLLVIIIAVPLYFDIHLHSVFDLSKITILYVLTFAMLAIWSIKTIINCRQIRPEPTVNGQAIQIQQYLRQPLILPILAFLFVSGFATVFSINPYLSLVGTYKRYGGFISTIVYISLFFIIIHFIDKKRLRSLLNVIILTACFASIYGILQHFGLDLYRWSTSFGFGIRVSATFGHPAFFSAFLIMVIPLILIKIFSNPSEQYCRASSNFRCSTFLYLGILTLLIVAFYYTKTRASFLGLLISNIFFFSLIGKKSLLANKTKTIVTITIIIGISIFFNVSNRTSVIGRFIEDIKPTLLDSKESPSFLEDSYEPARLCHSGGEIGIASKLKGSVFLRVFQYHTGLKIIHDYPILGIGPETLGMIYPQYLAEVYKEKGEYRHFENQNRIHSDFLDMAVSRGLLGLGVYLWFLFAYAKMVWKGCKKANSSDKALIIGLCASCLAYFIQNQFSFGHVPILTLFWFLVAMSVIASPVIYSLPDGMSARQCRSDGENPVKHKPELTRWTGALTIRKFVKQTFCGIIVCLMILLIILCLFRYKADIYFEHCRRTLNKSEIKEAIQSYEMAVKYNPLSLNYNNVLNGIYLKITETGINKDSKKTEE